MPNRNKSYVGTSRNVSETYADGFTVSGTSGAIGSRGGGLGRVRPQVVPDQIRTRRRLTPRPGRQPAQSGSGTTAAQARNLSRQAQNVAARPATPAQRGRRGGDRRGTGPNDAPSREERQRQAAAPRGRRRQGRTG